MQANRARFIRTAPLFALHIAVWRATPINCILPLTQTAPDLHPALKMFYTSSTSRVLVRLVLL